MTPVLSRLPVPSGIIVLLLILGGEDRAASQEARDLHLSKFPHTAVVRGRVVDERRRPIAAARITLSDVKGNTPPIDSYAALLRAYSTETDEEGEFRLKIRFAGEQPLRLTRIWVDARGYARLEDTREVAIPPGGEASLDYALQPGEVLAGRVHPLAAGLASAAFYRDHKDFFEVLRIQGDGFDQTCLTRPGGDFEVFVPAGTYTISVAGEDAHVEADTGSTDILLIGKVTPEPPQKLRDGFSALWADMDRRYSYFAQKPGVDWNKLREEFEPRVGECRSREELALELVRMLSRLEDMHIWLETGGQTVPTYQKPWRRNWNLDAVGRRLAESTTIGRFAQVGTTREDGFGYVAVYRLQAPPAEVEQLLDEMERRRDAPAFVLDLRMCAGGSEPVAQRIAQWFSAREAVYARHAYRNGPRHDDFGERRTRTLAAAASPYTGPVACLIGSRTMSSAEAFVLMMKTLPNATTVGAATRGASGNPQPFALPGLDIKVWYSRWAAMDAEGRVLEGTGIAPEVVVPDEPKDHVSEDRTFEKALEVLQSRADE